MTWAREHMVQGLPTYLNGTSLHDYHGFSVFQTELAAGEPARAVAGLYAELVHTTSTDSGWEWNIPPWGARSSSVDMSPHGTFAGDYVALLRNLLVAEAPNGAVNLLSGASPAWLAPGQHITVTNAPTDRGVISFTERSTAHGETLTWTSTMSMSTVLTWTLPWWAQRARTSTGQPVGHVLTLRAPSGTATVTFEGHRPHQSYPAAVSALNSAYRAHHLPAPLVPVVR
jgi:hypothetical protein